jgi:hypothetical protein
MFRCPAISCARSVRQAARELLIDGHTVLAPSSDHTHVVGDVKLVGLGSRCFSRRGLLVTAGRKTPEILTDVVAGAGFRTHRLALAA